MPKYNNSALRAKIRNELIIKHGRECMQCGTTQSKSGKKFSKMSDKELPKYLVLHEINAKKDLSGSNIRLLCKKCNHETNRLLKHRKNGQLTLDQYIYKNNGQLRQEMPHELKSVTLAMEKNRVGKPRFFKWLREELKEKQWLKMDYVLRNGASINVGNVGEDIIKKWLLPELAETGEFEYTLLFKGTMLEGQYVILKSDLPKFTKQKEHEKALEEKFGE